SGRAYQDPSRRRPRARRGGRKERARHARRAPRRARASGAEPRRGAHPELPVPRAAVAVARRTVLIAMRYRVTHTTTYSYEDVVSISHNEARITPRRTAGQSP